jgi:hypothetical protein
MIKSFLFSICLFVSFSSAKAATCTVQDAAGPFKADLEKNYFGGQKVSFRLLVNGPQVSSGKYSFVADDGKWSGPVKLDLQSCKMETDGGWVMWRTIDELGRY